MSSRSTWKGSARRAVKLALLGGLMSLPGVAGAQTRASVQLEGQGLQVHPATYEWEGKVEPVIDPGANFYTFFYTGTVLEDGTVPIESEIRRVAVSNLEWEQNRAAMVATIQSKIEGGQAAAESSQKRESIVNQNVRLDGNFEYVDTSKTSAAAEPDPSQMADPVLQAEWTFYYDQVVLWQYYCKRVILNDQSEDSAPNSSAEERQQREYIDAINAYEGDLRGINRRDLLAELSGGEDGEEGDPSSFAAAEYFDAKRDVEDQSQITALRDEFVRLASLREDRAKRIFDEMIDAIEARKADREKYNDWMAEKSDSLDDFVTAWTEVKDGRLLNFEGTYYLLTEEPIEAVPADARSVPVRDRVTPQDLIDADGTLKPAQYRPGY